MARKYLEILGTPDVLAAQERTYGRSRPVVSGAVADALGPAERDFIAARDSFYIASVSESGWPYLQHRGGPAGFLRVTGPTTLAFDDYTGNRQLITTGNLAGSDKVSLFLMDYPNRSRLKILGRARIEDAGEGATRSAAPDGPGRRDPVERVVVIDVVSFDWNCPKYITPRFTEAQVVELVAPLHREIAELKARLQQARASESGPETNHG